MIRFARSIDLTVDDDTIKNIDAVVAKTTSRNLSLLGNVSFSFVAFIIFSFKLIL